MELFASVAGRFRRGSDAPQAVTGDPRLVEAVIRGDPSAEAEFAERFYERVLTVAVHRMRNAEDARDVAQETILAALISLRDGRLKDPQRLPAFVYGTARNLINNHFRASGRRKETALDEEIPAFWDPIGSDIENRALVRAALDSLPPRDHEILYLTFLECLKPGEIAQRLGLHPDVVRARKARALKRIKQEIASIITKRRERTTEASRGVA